MTALWFEAALLPTGWARDVRIRIAGGMIASVEAGAVAEPDDERYAVALPGLPNLHSHAFQYLMAGLAEATASGAQDDFWGWRTLMYRLLDRLVPEDVAAIAAMAYVEMLEAGFTRVGEFHYLHHQQSGAPHDDPAEMAAAIAEASAETGIALTLLPVFYAHGGFGGQRPTAGQRRFICDLDGYVRLHDACGGIVTGLSGGRLGVAPHSLRAVTPAELDALAAIAGDRPLHIHVAEQVREVDECGAWSGQRPVAWLLDHAPVRDTWCLVHATHVDDTELSGIARSGATVGLCPITEANLGDGLFPAEAFLALGGRFGVGSDSNVRIDAAEELRLLEYGQRLAYRRRNRLAAGGRSTGRTLLDCALDGGSRALGAPPAAIVAGAPADIVALMRDVAATDDRLIDRWIFATGGKAVDTVWRDGRKLVGGGRHVARDAIARRYAGVRARLLTV